MKNNSDYEIEIKDPKGRELTSKQVVSGSYVYVLASAENGVTVGYTGTANTVSGAAIKLDKGTYRVKATNTRINKVINTIGFTVTDSQAAPTFKVDKYVTNDSYDFENALYDCFTFMLNGNKVQEDATHIIVRDGDKVEYTNSHRAYVKKVIIREFLDENVGTYIDHELTVNTNISWKAD
jgi:hypothetical protein